MLPYENIDILLILHQYHTCIPERERERAAILFGSERDRYFRLVTDRLHRNRPTNGRGKRQKDNTEPKKKTFLVWRKKSHSHIYVILGVERERWREGEREREKMSLHSNM